MIASCQHDLRIALGKRDAQHAARRQAENTERGGLDVNFGGFTPEHKGREPARTPQTPTPPERARTTYTVLVLIPLVGEAQSILASALAPPGMKRLAAGLWRALVR